MSQYIVICQNIPRTCGIAIEGQDKYIGLDTHAFSIKFKFEAIPIASLKTIWVLFLKITKQGKPGLPGH